MGASDPATISLRLRRALDATGSSKRYVERAAGLSKGLLTRLTKPKGYGDTSVRVLVAIAAAMDISEEWLVFGIGEMRHPAQPPMPGTPPAPPSERTGHTTTRRRAVLS